MFEAKGPCWKGYKQIGMKTKNGKEVPNCVPINENMGDPLDDIFIKYAGKTIEMDFTDMNSDWAQLLSDLEEYLPGDELVDAISRGDLEPYLEDYNITLMDPISDKEIDPDMLKKGNAKIEIDKMRHIAGLPSLGSIASLNENFDELDQIFQKYSNRNIIMKWSDKDFTNLLDDLYNYFRSDDDVTEFMATQADEYAKKYDIDFVEPDEFEVEVDPDVIPSRKSDIDFKPGAAASDGITSFDEIKRMQELAGLWEDDDEEEEEYEEEEGPEESDSEIISQDHMLTFNDEDTRNQAIMYFKNPNNQPREVQKYTRGRLQMHPEDAVSIMFPTQANMKACGLDERKLKGIVEIIHRAINKKFPNSKTMKMETK